VSKIPDGIRDDLGQQIAKESSLLGSKKSIKEASTQLRPSEKVLAATTTLRTQGKRSDNGVLIVSDERLLFVHARGFATASEEIPLSNISGIVDRKGMAFGHIIVTGAGGITTEFKNINKNRISELMEAIRSHLSAGPKVQQPVGAPDLVEQIRSLGELRDAGVLTEEEFSAKKADLLQRM